MLWRFLSMAVISLFQSNNSFALKGQITGELSYLNEALNYCFSESRCTGKVKMKHKVLMLRQMYSTVLNYIAHKYDKCDEQLMRFLYKLHQIGWDPTKDRYVWIIEEDIFSVLVLQCAVSQSFALTLCTAFWGHFVLVKHNMLIKLSICFQHQCHLHIVIYSH